MHHCVGQRSGSVPTEMVDPVYGGRSFGHVSIEPLQSKDFPENLVICEHFQTQSYGFGK